MAMTLRLDEDDTRRLRAQAEREGLSMQEVALSAVRARITQDDSRRRTVADRMLSRYGGAFRRLAEM